VKKKKGLGWEEIVPEKVPHQFQKGGGKSFKVIKLIYKEWTGSSGGEN